MEKIQPPAGLEDLTESEQELIKKPVVVPIDEKAISTRLGEARQKRLEDVKRKIAQGKWRPKQVFRPGPAVVAAPAWESGVGKFDDNDGKKISPARPLQDEAALANLVHGADLQRPLFEDRRADNAAEIDQTWRWYFKTKEGREMLALKAKLKLQLAAIYVKTFFMACFWIEAAPSELEGRLIGHGILAKKPATASERLRSWWNKDGEPRHFWQSEPNEYIGLLPGPLSRWWRFGLRLRNQIRSTVRLVRDPHVGGWRRLLSMLWRRRFPLAPTEKKLPQTWDRFKTTDAEGLVAYYGSPLPEKVTINGLSFADLSDAAVKLGIEPRQVAGPWFMLNQVMGSMPTREKVTEMTTALGEPEPAWLQVLIDFTRKLEEAFLTQGGAFLRFPDNYPKEAMLEFEQLRDRYSKSQEVARAKAHLKALLDRARFAEIREPGFFASFRDNEIELQRYSYERGGPVKYMDFEDHRAREFVEYWGFHYRSNPSKEEVLSAFDEFRRLGLSNKIVDKALTVYLGSVKSVS